MAVNYLLQIKATGATRLFSLHCRRCHDEGRPTQPFIGVEPKGRTILKDVSFQREVMRALQTHLTKQHPIA
tara:strand:+ start:303 stop:515 length:213 start_codon:yes stop_codon:yes gene_type:complete